MHFLHEFFESLTQYLTDISTAGFLNRVSGFHLTIFFLLELSQIYRCTAIFCPVYGFQNFKLFSPEAEVQ